MSNYSIKESSVRVDVFKHGGNKWSHTLEVDMKGFYNSDLLHEVLEQAIIKTIGKPLSEDCSYVCLEPYHKFSHPICLMDHIKVTGVNHIKRIAIRLITEYDDINKTKLIKKLNLTVGEKWNGYFSSEYVTALNNIRKAVNELIKDGVIIYKSGEPLKLKE